MASVRDNLLLLQERSGLTRSGLARELKLDRSTLSRTLDGKIKKPSHDLLEAFRLYFNISISDLSLDNSSFAEMMNNQPSKLPLLSFMAVELHRAKWIPFFERIKGSYLLYYGNTSDDHTIVSMLQFLSLTEQGVEIRFYNPFRQDGEISYYEYRGFAYPVNELVYIFGEQVNGNDYEILSLILMLGRTPTMGIVEGVIQGVGVKEGASMVAANSLFCRRASKQMEMVSLKGLQAMGCGYVKPEKLSVDLQKRLSSQIGRQKIRLHPH